MQKPSSPHFSSGPCAKRPGWSVDALRNACVGRSHRSPEGLSKIQNLLDELKALLVLPDDYHIALVPASDTGAMEMVLWNVLGDKRGVDVLLWEAFGNDWYHDAKLLAKDVRSLGSLYGEMPDLRKVDFDRDVIFCWNGTTYGYRVPHGEWIPERSKRKGLVICDATSAVFAQDIPMGKMDVLTFSWQKSLGSEAAHGIVVFSPEAWKRLEEEPPLRPLPKIFRMMKNGKINESLFKGSTINTPSMLCVEDALDAVSWCQKQGGMKSLIKKANANLACVARGVEQSIYLDFLCHDPQWRSNTSICLRFTDKIPSQCQHDVMKFVVKKLAKESVAYDIGAYRAAPYGLRIWGGPTIQEGDLEALMPWIDWACQDALENVS